LYNIETVRALCRDISAETNAYKVEELLALLQAVIKDDQEEIRLRMAFVAKKCPITIGEPEPTP
jgi:hypothetical protein